MRHPLPFALFALSLACGSSQTPFNSEPDASASQDGSTFNNNDGAALQAVGTLKGTVLAPEGTIPISGALVYLTSSAPPAIPTKTYCDRCVVLDVSTPHVFSNADGTFELPAYTAGDTLLVVQKGAFRRVRKITINGGTQQLPHPYTTLPGKMDKANGDDIPKMAVVQGAWDKIEASLEKLGLGTPNSNGSFNPATASFDVYAGKFPPVPNDPFDPYKFLADPVKMGDYHIVFIPCTSSNGTVCTSDTYASNSGVKSTLQGFVQAGGKLYVTDYSYEYVRQTWPGYVNWVGETSQLGTACGGQYDAPATVSDKGLNDWLTAIGIPSVTLKSNWTTIDKVNTVQGLDANNAKVPITPKVWVTGQTPSGAKPSTVSFQNGCGRVLFSTYHTEATLANGNDLLAQEKALLYVLLEVAVCTDQQPPK